MTSSTDTFLGFVDQVASRLDDHQLRGADLAAGAFLSRYHFDRLIRATAGEAPNQFRRRILLERAAYRLATATDGILEIAVQAGYSSKRGLHQGLSPRLRGGPIGLAGHAGPDPASSTK